MERETLTSETSCILQTLMTKLVSRVCVGRAFTKGSCPKYDKLCIFLGCLNVIPLLIGPSQRAPIISIMYHLGEGTRPCLFPVTGNGHGQGPSPILCMIEVFGAHINGPIRRGPLKLGKNDEKTCVHSILAVIVILICPTIPLRF